MNKQTRKRMVIIAIVSMMVMGGLYAQPGQGQKQPPPLPDESQIVQMVDELTQELSLSEEQTAQILGLYSDHFAEVEALMEDGRPDRTKMDKLKNKFEKKVKALLTDEQVEKYDEFLKSQRPQGGPRR